FLKLRVRSLSRGPTAKQVRHGGKQGTDDPYLSRSHSNVPSLKFRSVTQSDVKAEKLRQYWRDGVWWGLRRMARPCCEGVMSETSFVRAYVRFSSVSDRIAASQRSAALCPKRTHAMQQNMGDATPSSNRPLS